MTRGRKGSRSTLAPLMSTEEPPDGPILPVPSEAVEPVAEAPVETSVVDEPVAGEPVADEPVPEEVVDLSAVYPPVAAMVVTRNPGDWFDDSLRGLAEQDYPDLTVVVVDCGSQVDPSSRVAELSPGAFVRRLPETAGFAEAANEALHGVEGATFLLVCHDDVVLAPDVVRTLVEEAYRSNAGIVGPKLVAADDPSVLLDVGRAIDRFGAPYTGIEPGELDQEQHDGVRDVFYVTSAAMLVRADLFAALGGFDPATFPGAEDLDLCWRARLAGARVLVAPDARVSHREAAEERARSDRPDDVAIARSRVRVLLTSYSRGTLLWLIPFGFMVSIVEAIGDLLTGHPRRARAGVTAWFSNVFHFRRLRASRKRAQASRHVHDRDLRELQVGTGTRLSVWFNHHVHSEGRLRSLGAASRSAVDSVSDGVRAPATIAFMVFLGARAVRVARPDLARRPGDRHVRDLARHRRPVQLVRLGVALHRPRLAVRRATCAGADGRPRHGALRRGLARPHAGGGARDPAGRVRGVPAREPHHRHPRAGARGRARLRHQPRAPERDLGKAGSARSCCSRCCRSCSTPRCVSRAARATPVSTTRTRRGGADDSCASRCSPRSSARGSPSGWGCSCWRRSRSCSRSRSQAASSSRPAPWGSRSSSSLARHRAPVPVAPRVRRARTSIPRHSGFAFRTPNLDLDNILRFHSGTQGAGWAMWGLLIAAAVPLFTATGPRLAWAARGLDARAARAGARCGSPRASSPTCRCRRPKPASPSPRSGSRSRSASASRCSSTASARSGSAGANRPRSSAGSRSLLPVLGFTADTFNGRWRAPSDDWTQTLAFTQSLATRGQFRMLWVGDPTVLPLDPVVLDDGTGYTLTRNGPGDVTEQWRAPQHSADDLVDRAIELSEAGLTNRLGRMLAPMGVRYVVLPSTQGTDGGAKAPPSRALSTALASQLDLARLRSEPGLRALREPRLDPAAGRGAGRPVGATCRSTRADPTRAALGVELTTQPVGTAPVAPGTVLWAEAFDSHWAATSRGADLRHVETFGWSNGYRRHEGGHRRRSSTPTSGNAGRSSAARS